MSTVFGRLFLASFGIVALSLSILYFLLPHGIAIATSVALAVALLAAGAVARQADKVVSSLSAKADAILDSVGEKIADQSDLGRIDSALEQGARTLTQTAETLESADQRRREFIANVSHELRTPLTAIQGYAETLADDQHLTVQSREFLAVLQENVRRMSRLTADLLTLARFESSNPQLHFIQVPATELLHEAFRGLEGAAGSKKIELHVEAIVPRAVNADPDAIYRVFSNLIENAIKYSSGSGSRIMIGAKEVESGIEFYVRDFGAGIPAEHHDRLFERFYRVDKGRSIELGGTGLGLAIVKHVVLQHGGTVRMESQPGSGSVFAFTLPTAV